MHYHEATEGTHIIPRLRFYSILNQMWLFFQNTSSYHSCLCIVHILLCIIHTPFDLSCID